ncbi:MAG TPA: glycoside hydrolase family 2 TIM barrel-domain containing protein [Flavobacterium sp.]|nr:glycoside hydrolase family 2 TIM barrel-domain containing protein [Flavobacterium sp.]
MIKSKFYLSLLILTFISFLGFAKELPNRETFSLNGQWNFFVDSTANSTINWAEKGLSETLKRTVIVPHTWNVEKGLEKYTGVCWYERSFTISNDQLSKMVRLQFDAVYHSATIYINGKKAGDHLGSGYNRFYVDVSPFLKTGKNVVTVRVDNSFSKTNIPYMKSFDWACDGGITRGVQVVITNREAIKLAHVNAVPQGKGGVANFNVSFLDSLLLKTAKPTIEVTITEENQRTSKQLFKGVLNGKYEKGVFKSTLHFNKVNLWHFDAPNLYKISFRLLVNGLEKDEYETTFGFRSIKVENNHYVLNGEPMRLMGVEWMPGSNMDRGMAETTADLEKSLKLMKNANCIFTRFHWQQDEAVFDWCDRNGILVQEEIPYWGGATMLNDTLLTIGKKHLDEMIENHYNHPSIISWGIGNELESHNPENVTRLKTLYNEAKIIDSSRLVNFVSNKLHKGKPIQKDYIPDASGEFDMLMFNEYYSTWFGKSIDVIGNELDRISAEYNNKPMTISEWGLCEPAHKGGDPRRINEMTEQLKIYGSKPYIAGAIYFCLNDYRTHMGEDFTYSYPLRVHGVTDINLNPKPSYETLKTVSSPIEFVSFSKKNNKIQITLKGNTGLPSYIVRNYYIMLGKTKIIIPEVRPGEEQTFEIPATKEIKIYRPTGFEVLYKKLD